MRIYYVCIYNVPLFTCRYVLQESMLYVFTDSDDVVPKHVMFLDGCYIDVVSDPPREEEGLWAFNIV
jgi:hypothetical protein